MTKHFNVALLPQDQSFARACIEFAQANFSRQASEYLLGDNAHAHITLCQFEAETEPEQLQTLWLTLAGLQVVPVSLKFGHIYCKPGVEIHQGKYWVGLAIANSLHLADLQKSVSEELARQNIQSKTPSQTYFPHLTWARCDYDKPIKLDCMPPQDFWRNEYQFAMSLGRSDQYGVYRGQIYPAP
jgi:2'-5' RNA ligase